MLSQKVVDLINYQINQEFFSAYLYLDISNYYMNEGLEGFSNWYKIQAQEERDHALLFVQYLQNNGKNVILEAIAKPEKEFTKFIDPLKVGLEHEQYVTSLIHNIYDSAYAEKDFRTMQFLDWFVKEQGEEENNADTLIKKFELFASDAKGLYMLDSELAARVYSAPSLVLD
ncbi:MAG: ferritin [Mobilitalea sp.]